MRCSPSVQSVLVAVSGILVVAGLATGASAQAPVLVKNINTLSTSNSNSNPGTALRQGTLAFFTADDGVHGIELWVTDGTEVGTHMVKEIRPGTTSPAIASMAPLGTDRIVFGANDGTNGTELWVSDGTEAGTMMVVDIQAGGSSTPSGFAALDANTVIFTANNGNTVNGNELWRTDGTAAGTMMVKDIEPGTGSSGPSGYALYSGKLYFRATSTALGGTELWVTDGTGPGTSRVADIHVSGNSSPDLFTVSGPPGARVLYFIATDATSGTELWKYDGVAAARVKDINPTGSGLSSSNALTDVDGTLFFSATDGASGRELYATDGSDPGTYRVIDLNPGAGDGVDSSSTLARTMVSRNGQVLFAGTDGTTGFELWTSTGAPGNATLVKNINPGLSSSDPTNMRIVGTGPGALLFCSATEATTGQELWVSDGTTDGTVLVKNMRPGVSNASPLALSDFSGVLLFSVEESTVGRELFRSDGSPGGTTLVKDIRVPNTNTGSVSSDLTVSTTRAIAAVGNRLYLRANDAIAGQELWISDATGAGTVRVADINPGGDSLPAGLTDVNGRLFFAANDGASGTELYTLDAMSVPFKVKEIRAATASGVTTAGSITNLNGLAIFVGNDGSTGDEIWKSDGTETGTAMVQELRSGTTGINASSFAVFGGYVYFNANNGVVVGQELYRTDGVTVELAADIPDTNAASAGSAPANLTPAAGGLFFSAAATIAGSNAGRELWIFDGVQASPVKDIRAGTASSSPTQLTHLAGKVYFVATDGNTAGTFGNELWVSDGSSVNTVRLSDIGAGTADGNITGLTVIGGAAVYFAGGPTTGTVELWKYEVSGGVVSQVADINPSGASSPTSITDVNGVAYFAATDGTTGVELYKSDGSGPGTGKVADLNSAGSSNPRNFRVVRDGVYLRLYFTADNGVDGEELYVLSVCRADFNNSGSTTIDDLFLYINAWFLSTPRADVDGVNGITIDDLFLYFNLYFVGC